MSHFNYYSDSQWMFDRVLSGLRIAAKWFLKSITYIPFWFTGYMLASQFLTKDYSPLLWIFLTLLFAFALYLLLFFIKGIMISFKQNSNLIWIPLFLFITAFTSALPAWISFNTFHSLARLLTKQSADLVAYIFCLCFGLYIYSRYQFLSNTAPGFALPFYKFGINTGLFLSTLKRS